MENGTGNHLYVLSFKTKRKMESLRALYIDPEQGSIDSYLESYENEGYDLNIYIIYTYLYQK